MRRAPIVAAALVLALGIGAVFVPFLSKQRDTRAGTPSPEPLPGRLAVPALRPGSKMCLTSLALPPEMGGVQVRIGTYFRAGQPLELDLRAAGYHERSWIAGTYDDNELVEFPVTPPTHEVLANGCITNHGDRRVAVYSTKREQESARPSVTIDDREKVIDPGFVLVEADRVSIADRVPEAVERAALFRPLDTWAVWILLVVVVAAVLVLPLLALWSSMRAEES
jgi:hypothetical protein